MLRIPARGRHITQEPQTIAPHLLGTSLATFRRRLFAFLLDLALFGLIVGTLFVAWFTLWTLVTRGRSPGKALFRLRVIRLDGKPLRLWDCFSRSGGYGASAATLMLGFLEAIWHPNRQAIHDKIAGTVVVRAN